MRSSGLAAGTRRDSPGEYAANCCSKAASSRVPAPQGTGSRSVHLLPVQLLASDQGPPGIHYGLRPQLHTVQKTR